MPKHPRCAECGRSASDWINVRGVNWEPNLDKVKPGKYLCWKCRGEPHPDMHLPSIEQSDHD